MGALKGRIGLAALGVAVGCSSSTGAGARCPPSPFRAQPPLVIAHAGGEGLGPSNTILAMERSMDAGADILDVDLRMTADGVVVARHDRDVATTTDRRGYIDELAWTDLVALDAAAGRGTPAGEPVRIPSLEQVLRRFPDQLLSLELKQVAPSMAVPLCELLRRTRSTGRVYLSANDDDAVYAAHAACPEVVITTTYRDLDAMRAAEAIGSPWCAPAPIGQPPYRDGRFDRARVQRSHDRGQALFVWTVDDPETLRQLAAAGVDGVYTRRPDIARAVFGDPGSRPATAGHTGTLP